MKLVKDYMRDDFLRRELNALTEKVFGFHFEDWVANGYFEGDYIPYSLEENGKLVSNVSANKMRFWQHGKIRNYIQLGTVMTDAEHRKQGLARKLMEHVLNEYEDRCEGVYLFGNLGVLDFYRKLGFEEKAQYSYTLKKGAGAEIKARFPKNAEHFQKVSPVDGQAKKRYGESVKSAVPYGAFDQVNKYGLQMFYTADLENVYYAEDLACFAVISRDGDTVELQSVISQKRIPIEQVIGAIDLEYADLKLGFTPSKDETYLFECARYDGGNDYRLFCRGRQLDSIEKEKLYFPVLSHA